MAMNQGVTNTTETLILILTIGITSAIAYFVPTGWILFILFAIMACLIAFAMLFGIVTIIIWLIVWWPIHIKVERAVSKRLTKEESKQIQWDLVNNDTFAIVRDCLKRGQDFKVKFCPRLSHEEDYEHTYPDAGIYNYAGGSTYTVKETIIDQEQSITIFPI